MTNAKILDFSARKQTDEQEAGFLDLIDSDIKNDPAAIKPIPSSLLDRIDRLSEIVAKSNQDHLLEG